MCSFAKKTGGKTFYWCGVYVYGRSAWVRDPRPRWYLKVRAAESNEKRLMWFSCKKSFETVPKRIKFILKAMAVVAVVLYITLVLCQNVHGYQTIKVHIFGLYRRMVLDFVGLWNYNQRIFNPVNRKRVFGRILIEVLRKSPFINIITLSKKIYSLM